MTADDIQWDLDSLPPDHPLRIESKSRATQRRASPFGDAPPTTIDRYTILGELGRGGMATVYRARDERGREVALKVIREGGNAARLLREGRLAAKLHHTGILPIHDVGEVNGRPYLVCRLIEGAQTLEDILTQVEQRRGVELLRDVAAALAYAHQHGVVHRDVKPDNVLVDVDGRLLVADFGLGLPLDQGAERLTKTGAVLGTPLFMAPELLEGNREQQGPWTDVWSVGVMLYLVVSKGAYPHPGPSLINLVTQVQHRPPPLPAAPRALVRIYERALAQDPRERYPTAAELCADLEAYLARPPAGSRRGGGWLLGAALALVALVGGAVWFTLPDSAGPEVPAPDSAGPQAPLPVPKLTVSNGPRNPGLLIARAPSARVVVGQARLTSSVDAVLSRLALRANGSIDERLDLGPTVIHVDENGDGVLDASDPPLGPELSLANNARVALSDLRHPLRAGEPLDVLLVTEVKAGARVGDTVSFLVEGDRSSVIDSEGAEVPIAGGAEAGLLQVVSGARPKTIHAAQGPTHEASAAADAERVPMLSLQLSSSTGEVDLHGLTFHTSGSGDDARDVLEARLGHDTNRNGVLESDEVQVVSRPDADDGALVFGMWGPRLNANAPVALLVDYTLAGTARPGDTFALQLTSNAGVNAHAFADSGGQTIELEQTPIRGVTLTVEAASSTLNVEAVGAAAKTEPGGRQALAMTLELRTNASPVELRELNVTASGTLDDAVAVEQVGLYLDADGDGDFDPSRDSELASAQRFAHDDGGVVFSISEGAPPLAAESTTRVFVTTTLAPGLAPGQSLALSLDPVRDVKLAGATVTGASLSGTLLVTGGAHSAWVQPNREVGKDVYLREEGLFRNDNFGQVLGLVVGDRSEGGQSGERLFFAEFPLPAGGVPERAYVALYLVEGQREIGAPLDVQVTRVVSSGVRTPWIEGRGGLDPTLDGMVYDGEFRSGRPDLSQPDVDPTPLCERRIVRGGGGQWVLFEVTAAARAWYSGEAENFGLRFRDKNVASKGERTASFHSSDESRLPRLRPIFLIER